MKMTFKWYALSVLIVWALQNLQANCQQISAHTLDLLRSHANKGDIQSEFTLAMLFAKGEKVPGDWTASAEWFRKAAEAGDVTAQYNLAMLYEAGYGVDRSFAEASEWLRRASATGDTYAEGELARLDYIGRDVPLNYPEAAKLLLDCIKRGGADDYLINDLGILYLEGRGVPRNDEYAFHYFADAAADPHAAFNVAVMLFRGQGTPKDEVNARWWANKALDQLRSQDTRARRMVRFLNEGEDPGPTLGIPELQANPTSSAKTESHDMPGEDLLFVNLSSPAGTIGTPLLRDEAWTWHFYRGDPKSLKREDLEQIDQSQPINLRESDLSNGDLSRLSFGEANLEGAILWGTQLGDDDFKGAKLKNADLDGAVGEPDFTGADLSGADLSGADLNGTFRDAILKGTKLGNTQLEESDLSGASYEPAVSPEPSGIELARGLGKLRFEDVGPISHLRDSLLAAGYKDAAKWVNVSIHRHEQKWFEYLFFDATCEWGANWARPLKLIVLVSLVFAMLYWVSMHFRGGAGIYLVTTGQRIVTSSGRERVLRLSTRYLFAARPVYLKRAIRLEARALGTSVLFSLMSVFNIGFRDFNFGRWIRMLQSRDFDLRASGWVRTASGIESLLGVGLAALSLLSYFGHPFQ